MGGVIPDLTASPVDEPRSAPRPLLIAIPFYKNEHLVGDVLGSLLRCAADVRAVGGEVVCYDDSPDYAPLAAALDAILPQAAAQFPCRIDRNPVNLGFVRTMNRAIEEAIERRFDLLLLNSDTMVEPGALTEMARVARLDSMTAFVNPRSNNATIATLPLAGRFGGAAPTREAYRTLAAMLPEYSYVPTAVGFCMLIRWHILAAFGGFDEIYGKGYNEENDLVMRASRCGYRAVLANHAFVWHEGEQSFGTADLSREHWEPVNRAILDERYPEYGGYTGAHYNAPETIAEQLLAALVPDAAGRLDFAFDFSSFVAAHNGTFQAGRQLLAAAQEVLGQHFDLYVLCSEEVFEFSGYAEFGVERRDPHGPEKYALLFRVGQPYDWNAVQRLATKGAVTGIYMLDTISIDCPQLTSPRLFNLWQFAMEQSDLVAALSRMTLEALVHRFRLPDRVALATVLLSFDLDDYHIPGTGEPAPGTGTLLVLGNHYQHKHLAPTANALAAAFPDRSIVALGEEKVETDRPLERYVPQHLGPAPNLSGVAVGNLDEEEVGTFYADADVIIFPSHYEGFGIPVLHALAAHRPIFVRAMPVSEELWHGVERNPNIHFYTTTPELIDKLRDPPRWIEAPAQGSGNGAARALQQILDGLDTARQRIDYRRLADRLRAVQFVSDAGGFQPAAASRPAVRRRKSLRIGALLRLDGADFVRQAYQAVLARDPDRGGLAHYTERLAGKGREEKLAVLRILVESPEGRKLGAHLPGLQGWTRYYRLRQVPLSELPRHALRRLLRGAGPAPSDPH